MPAFSEDSEEAIHLIGKGMRIFQTASLMTSFTLRLAKLAGVLGAEQATTILSGWMDGEPLWFRSYAILNGIYLSEPVEPLAGVRLDPLPQSVEDLPLYLSTYSGSLGYEYLGRTLLTIECGAMPAFFRPPSSLHERVVQIGSVPGLHIDTICRALSLGSVDFCICNRCAGPFHVIPSAGKR